MSVQDRLEGSRSERTFAAWVGLTAIVLGAMIAWALRFTAGYLFTPLSCEIGAWVQWLTSGVFLLVGVAALVASLWLVRKELDAATRFLAYVGVALNLFFVGVMLLETTAIVFVDVCAKGAIP